MSFLQTFTGAGVSGAITAAYRAGYQTWEKVRANFVALNAQFATGAGSPEGTVTADVAALYFQTDGVDGTTLWTKVSGSGNTGWRAVQTSTTYFVRTAIVTLTNAQIKALSTTPVTLVAAPLSGLRVKVLGASLQLAASAGAYTNINTTSATLAIQSSDGDWLTSAIPNDSAATAITSLTQFLQAAAASVVVDLIPGQAYARAQTAVMEEWVVPFAATYINETAKQNGKAVQIAIDNNGSGALTGGNAANTLKVTVYYALEPV